MSLAAFVTRHWGWLVAVAALALIVALAGLVLVGLLGYRD